MLTVTSQPCVPHQTELSTAIAQRVNYKKLKEGKPTAMTAEKALKLTEIGFCFNASDRFRGNKQEERPQAEYNNMYAEVPPLPPTEYAWRGRYTE